MDINYFRKINNVHGVSSKREADLLNVKRQIESDFDRYSEIVFLNGIEQEMIIMDDSLKEGTKKAISRPSESFNCGDILELNNKNWIVIALDPNESIYTKGIITQCVGILKWQNQNGLLIEIPFTFKSDPATNFGITDGRILSFGNERRNLIIPLNEESKHIAKDKRFIFDGRAWKVTAIDRISVSGLLILTLDENEIDKAKDNLELGIADYFSPVVPTPEPVEVGYSIVIVGSDYIKKGMSQTYIASVFADGVIDPQKIVTWQLLDDSESGSTTLASITNQSSTEATVKAGTIIGQYVELRAVLTEDASVIGVKRIQIKGLY